MSILATLAGTAVAAALTMGGGVADNAPKHGAPAESKAVEHVTKVQGADKVNDIFDTAQIYTDFSGGFMSGDSGAAKLIASAFADWKHSDNGLVTVYGSDGKMISNGNY